MKVAIAGDWHGETGTAMRRIREVSGRGVRTLLHVGDFGLGSDHRSEKYLRKVERVCAERDVSLLITPGNHDGWGRLTTRWSRPENIDGRGRRVPLRLTDHVRVLPPGHRWQMDGRTFVSLGGAASVDFETSTPGRDWWPEEVISDEDVTATVAGGHADVMVTHEAPDAPFQVSEVARVLAENPHGWSERALDYSASSRAQVTRALLGVQPRMLVHGHMHVSGISTVSLPHSNRGVTIWALDCGHAPGSLRYLNLATLAEV